MWNLLVRLYRGVKTWRPSSQCHTEEKCFHIDMVDKNVVHMDY